MSLSIIEKVLAIKPGEKVCIFTDTEQSQNITHLLAANVKAAGAEPVIVAITAREVGGIDPPPPAAAAIQAADVVIDNSSFAIVHTQTIRDAFKLGVRLCEMWGFTEEMMVRGGALADYTEIAELCQRIAQILTSGKEARMTTADGTDLTVSLENRQGHILNGTATEPGRFCAFPDGEAAIAPVEGSAQGVLVNPFCMEKAEIGFLKEDLSMKIAGGKVVDIAGGVVASQLLAFVEQIGDSARNIAELGIGTNRKARLGVTVKEAKKCWGTAHFALGDSKSLGGSVESPLHMDMIFREPTLVVDGQTVIKEGKVSV
ncbi:aminopeptidase [Chloroflexota bacterium]